MLLTVEGGGFFSSSASGYTSGLALLLFGQRNDEQPMRVSPWNHYQSVDQEIEPKSQPVSGKKQNSQACASFNCFTCAHAQLNGESPNKVSLVSQSETSSDSSSSETTKITSGGAGNLSERKPCLKANLKKLSRDFSSTLEGGNPGEFAEPAENEISCPVGRKVQWTDKCGKELVEIKEFEMSDYGPSDEESERENFRRCECVIQ